MTQLEYVTTTGYEWNVDGFDKMHAVIFTFLKASITYLSFLDFIQLWKTHFMLSQFFF